MGNWVKYFLVSIPFITGCKSDINERIISEGNSHFKKMEFNKNVLTIESEYIKVDTGLIPDGFYKEYYANEQIRMLQFYKNGKLDSFYYYYDFDGVLLKKYHFFNDSLLGSQYDYYYNTGKVKKYVFILTQHRNAFTIDYDSISGEIREIKGHSILLDISNHKHIFNKRDTVEFYNLLFIPKKTKFILSTFEYNKMNKCIYSDTTDTFDYYPKSDINIYPCLYYCADGPGRYVAITKLYDSSTNKLYLSDTVKYEINIK